MNIKEEILRTRDIAVDFHSRFNGLDKAGNIPYYWHLMRVMLRLQSDDVSMLKSAIMHDTLEDTDATVEKLQNLHFPQKEIEDIKWCSKNFFPNMPFKKWMMEIGDTAPLSVKKIKVSDISDNMSYERNLAFYKKPYFRNRPTVIPNPKTLSNMNLEGTIKNANKGIYERYYFGLNEITKNHPELISEIYTKDFTDLIMLGKLKSFLYPEDKDRYFETQKIRVFSVNGKCEILQDSKGQDYIGVNIKNDYMSCFEQYMLSNNLNVELEKKLNRDKGAYHITVANVAEVGMLKKEQRFEQLIKDIIDREFSFFVYGLGKIEIDNDKAYYVVVENAEINEVLRKHNLREKNFHITIGFNNKDLHKKPKNRETVFVKNNDLWLHVEEKPAFEIGLNNFSKNKL